MRRLGFDRFSGIYLWAVIIIVFGILLPSTFLTSTTLHSIASQQAISGIIAIAVLIPLIAGHYDLSVGANANLCGIIAVLVQNRWGWSPPETIFFAVAIGAGVGLINGLIVVYLRVNSFIATLGMGSVLGAVLVIVTASVQPPPPVSSGWSTLSQQTIFGFQIVVLYLLLVGVVAWWFLDHTPWGRYMRATGVNPEAARLSGVRVNHWSLVSLIVAGGVAGIGGALYTSLTGPALSFGAGMLLPAFAAVFLGSTQFFPGRFNVWGTILAIYVLATGVTAMELISGQQWLSGMFDGVALIVAVALSVGRQGHVSRTSSWRLLRRPAVVGEGDLDIDAESNRD